MSGATFSPHGDTFVLKRLRAASPAAEAGLQVGDLLVRLDGTSADQLRLRDIVSRLSAGDGEQVRIEIRRADVFVRADLTLKRRF